MYRISINLEHPLTVLMVGCGGTGGFVAPGLCRLLPPNAKLVLVDHDLVEERNLGRQNFFQEDLGRFKSQALAERLARKFGRAVGYSVNPFAPRLIEPRTVVVGCVDNGLARAAIAKAMVPWHGGWWLDSGNGDNWGQVLIGNDAPEHMRGAFDQAKGICYALPLPTIQQPELLAGRPQPAVSCAEAVEQDTQNPLINQFMAVLVLEVVRRLLAGTLTWMQVYQDMESGTMRTVDATPETVARMTGVKIRQLVLKG